MSCVSFGSTGDGGRRWLERLRAAADDPRPVAQFLSPEASEAKIRRVRQLAVSDDPKIRESAALSYLAPPDLLAALALDADRGVRCCVARNERSPVDVLGELATDVDPGVRGWVATNPTAGALVEQLKLDADPTVRSVAKWATGWPSRAQ